MRRFPRRAALVSALALVAVVLPALPVTRAPTTSLRALDALRWREAGRFHVADLNPGHAVSLVVDGTHAPGAQVQVRARRGGAWTPWQPLEVVSDHAPDPGSREAAGVAQQVSEPVWTGRAERVELRTDAPQPGRLRIHAVAVDGLGYRPPELGASGAAATALPLWPPIVPRTSWDPGGSCRPLRAPRFAPSVQRVYIHHTAIFPHYAPHESDDIVRAICLQHRGPRGFRDLGYNFLIDQYGVIFQGRAGGILQPVIGAHAAGFNRGSVGIAVIGDFDSHAVPAPARDSLERLVAWLVDLHGLDPSAITPHTSGGGATTRFPEGSVVALPTVLGHRDTGAGTTCPGRHLYALVSADGGVPPLVAGVEARRAAGPQGPGLPGAAVRRLARDLLAPLSAVLPATDAAVRRRRSRRAGRPRLRRGAGLRFGGGLRLGARRRRG